jgi:hypothetical protein
MAEYYFHANVLWRMACEARDRATTLLAQQPDAAATDVTVAIVLSAAAAEGFINELAEMCHPDFTGARHHGVRVPQNVSSFGEAMREIEKNRGSTLFKYLMASYTLSGTMFDKGANPYQDLALLFDLRDMHMHLKPIDQAGRLEGEMRTTVLPKKIQTFQTRGLARPSTRDRGISWFYALQTEAMARWSCETSLNMMLSVLNMISDYPGDSTSGIKWLLRQYTGS